MASADEGQALPPAKSIFKVVAPAAVNDCAAARVGDLLGVATPAFTLLTSRGMPLSIRPDHLGKQFQGNGPLFYQLPYGDLVVRQDLANQGGGAAAAGCSSFWPHLRDNIAYCSFRNPLKQQSIYGGDAVLSVDTVGGRRKVAVKDLLDVQRTMRANIMAAPGEEVMLDVTALKRINRAVARADDWLQEILQAKAQDPNLNFDWHVLACIQGAGDLKLRQKACTNASSAPVAGVWIGGLGYSEGIDARGKVLEAVSSALPPSLPRFLPLNCGNPIEVLQAVLLGVDMLEVTYPTEAANASIALTFEWQMPDNASATDTKVLAALLPGLEEESTNASAPSAVKQIQLRATEWHDNFEPISVISPVQQYSRAYLHHLCQSRELLGTMLLVKHNLFVYSSFFEAIRNHIRKGTLRQYASWFMTSQTAEAPAAPPPQAAAPNKRRKT